MPIIPDRTATSLQLDSPMLKIRPATSADVLLVLRLIRELADYERMPNATVATTDNLLRDGWGPEPKFRCVIAEWNDKFTTPEWHTVAFALFFYNYSTFQGRPGLYVEDFFVRPAFRRKGIGKALFIHLAKLALSERCGQLQWQVLDWNAPAIEFYKSLGAHFTQEWLTMRLQSKQLEKLATDELPPPGNGR